MKTPDGPGLSDATPATAPARAPLAASHTCGLPISVYASPLRTRAARLKQRARRLRAAERCLKFCRHATGNGHLGLSTLRDERLDEPPPNGCERWRIDHEAPAQAVGAMLCQLAYDGDHRAVRLEIRDQLRSPGPGAIVDVVGAFARHATCARALTSKLKRSFVEQRDEMSEVRLREPAQPWKVCISQTCQHDWAAICGEVWSESRGPNRVDRVSYDLFHQIVSPLVELMILTVLQRESNLLLGSNCVIPCEAIPQITSQRKVQRSIQIAEAIQRGLVDSTIAGQAFGEQCDVFCFGERAGRHCIRGGTAGSAAVGYISLEHTADST